MLLNTNLLNFSCCAPEEFNVSFTQQVLMLPQCVLCVLLASEEDEGVPCGPAIGVGDEEDAFLPPRDGAMLSKEGHHFIRRGREREPPHADNDLVFLGEKLGYLVGRT